MTDNLQIALVPVAWPKYSAAEPVLSHSLASFRVFLRQRAVACDAELLERLAATIVWMLNPHSLVAESI